MPLPTSPAILLAFASIGLIAGRSLRPVSGRFWGIYCLVAVLLTAGDLFADPFRQIQLLNQTTALSAWVHDPLAGAAQWLVVALGLLVSLTLFDAQRFLPRSPDLAGFLLFLLAGLMLVAGANDCLSLGLSLEIVSLAAIALRRSCGSTQPSDTRSQRNSGWLAAIASGCFWLGVSLFANSLATTHFEQIRSVLIEAYDPGVNGETIGVPSKLVLLSAGLMMISLLARMGMAPFHFQWTSLARHEPLWVSGLLMQTGNLAGTFALCRLLGFVFVGIGEVLLPLVMAFSLATLAIACLLALRGFSPGVKSVPPWTVCLILFEAVITGLGFMTLTAELQHPGARWGAFLTGHETLSLMIYSQFAFLFAFCGIYFTAVYLSRGDRPIEFLEDFKGLGRISPVPAFALMVGLASVVGCPLTAGFWGRWMSMLYAANVHVKSTTSVFIPQAGLRFLMLSIAVATTLIAAIAITIFRQLFLELPFARPTASRDRCLISAALISTAVTLVLGFAPHLVLIPLESLSTPRTVPPAVPSRGSGKNSLGFHQPQVNPRDDQLRRFQGESPLRVAWFYWKGTVDQESSRPQWTEAFSTVQLI